MPFKMSTRDPRQALREWASRLSDEAMDWRKGVLAEKLDENGKEVMVAVEAFWAAAKSLTEALDMSSLVGVKAQQLIGERAIDEFKNVDEPSSEAWQNLARVHLQLEQMANDPPPIPDYKNFMREQFIPAYNEVWGQTREPLCPNCGKSGGKMSDKKGMFCRKKCKRAFEKTAGKETKSKKTAREAKKTEPTETPEELFVDRSENGPSQL